MSHANKRLWAAVIIQAIEDYLSTGTKVEDIHACRQAKSWFKGNSADYKAVCMYADIDPDYLRGTILKSDKSKIKEILNEYRRTM